MLAAVIKDNLVVSLIVADANIDTAPEGHILRNADASVVIGSVYNPVSGEFTPPPPPAPVVPEVITPRQTRLLLLQQNLLASVESLISQQDDATKIAWEYASEFRRTDPLLTSLAQQLGLTSQQLDDFFIAASVL